MRHKFQKKSGFTMLEIIIVIIIIGILASVALPKYFKTVEYARGFEALVILGNLRFAMYRYYAPQRTYLGATLDNLDVENPMSFPATQRSFDYVLVAGLPTFDKFTITATRRGDPTSSSIAIDQDGIKTGTGSYNGVR